MITNIPTDHRDAELAKLGLDLSGARPVNNEWRGDEMFIQYEWPNGARRWVGIGRMASRILEQAHIRAAREEDEWRNREPN